MNVNELRNSQFLTKEDCMPDILVTIKSCEEKDVSMENEPTKMKWVMFFKELEKPLVLNMTNGLIISAVTGSEDSEDWIGNQIVLYNDPTVSFAGKLTGGIRVRPVRGQGQPPAKPPGQKPQTEDTTDHNQDDIPF